MTEAMENFIYDIPTKVYFGKGQLNQLADIVQVYGQRVLLVYGGGSIQRNGIYDAAVAQLKKAGKKYEQSY